MSKLLLHTICATTATASHDVRLKRTRRCNDVEVKRTVAICLFALACIAALIYGEWFNVPS